MKNKILKTLLISTLILASFANAIVVRGDKDLIHIKESQIITDDLYLAGNVIIIDGTINGSIFAVCKEIYVNGTINGDLNFISEKALLNQKSIVSIRGLARELDLSGSVKKDVLIAGEKIKCKSLIAGNLLVAASQATISNKILGNGTIRVGELIISDLYVKGNLEYMATESSITQNLMVGGNTVVLEKQISEKIEEKMPWGKIILKVIFGNLYSFVVAYIFGLIWVIFMPNQASLIVMDAIKAPIRNFFLGLILLLLTPVICILLAFTFVGLPFALIIASTVGIGFYMSRIFIAIIIGKLVLENIFYKCELEPTRVNKHNELLFGLFLIYIISMIPYLGFWSINLSVLAGFGAFAKTRVDMYKTCAEKGIF